MRLLAVRRMLQAVLAALMRVEPGVDRGPARAAGGHGGVGPGEADALFGKAIEMGRADRLVAVTAEIEAEIVGDDQNDVLALRLGVGARRHKTGNANKKQSPAAHGDLEVASSTCS